MKPIKQTVYLPVSEFNSSERAICTIGIPDLYGDKIIEKDGYFFTSAQLNEYTANVIRQALETAAENAKVVKDLGEDLNGIPVYEVTECYYDENGYPIYTEEESITNTFEETYNKLKV